MTKNTKTAITIGAVAIVGYLVYNRIIASGTGTIGFANANGTNECVKPLSPCPKLPGACYRPTRGGIPGVAPIGCFGMPMPPRPPMPMPPTPMPPTPRPPFNF